MPGYRFDEQRIDFWFAVILWPRGNPLRLHRTVCILARRAIRAIGSGRVDRDLSSFARFQLRQRLAQGYLELRRPGVGAKILDDTAIAFGRRAFEPVQIIASVQRSISQIAGCSQQWSRTSFEVQTGFESFAVMLVYRVESHRRRLKL